MLYKNLHFEHVSSLDIEDKTPGTYFNGEKAQVSHFGVFGCLIYIHIVGERRTKLEPSSLKGTLVGYNETYKAYKVYILSKWKMVFS